MKTRSLPPIDSCASPFAMMPSAFGLLKSLDIQSFSRTSTMPAVADDDIDVTPERSMTADGIRCISIVGVLTRYGSVSGPSTIAVGNCVRDAAECPRCTGIMLIFDSPGGSADGIESLAYEIANAGTKKPLWGYVDGTAASAAYWACSQCQWIVCPPASLVGSIGTFGVMHDRSKQFANKGVKAVVVRAGEMKGTGTPGERISDDQIADQSRVINQINDLFVNRVASGRKVSLPRARELADGRIYVGANAMAQGLVDQIGNYDDAMTGIRTAIAAAG